MTNARKNRLITWLSRARSDLEQVAAEIERLDDDPPAGVSEEVAEVRVRLDALESRVEAIEGTPR